MPESQFVSPEEGGSLLVPGDPRNQDIGVA
jgi:hypothetical protein